MSKECDNMLVQFSVKNVLSFKEEAILDLTAINAYKEHQCNLIDIGLREKFLRVAAIYGANASGKSNLHLAMGYFQEIVANSLNNVKDDESTSIQEFYAPFSFDCDNKNSEFQVIEIIDNIEYRYGFEYNDKYIVAEWLYKRNLDTNRQTVILERTKDDMLFGASVRKECLLYKDQIPTETLALSFFNKLKLKTDIFKIVYSAIMDTLVLDSDISDNGRIIENFLPKFIDNEKESLIEFLTAIDTGIKDIIYTTEENNRVRFETVHIDSNNNKHFLNLYNESAGTIKAIVIFIYAKITIWSNASLFIDELNNKLHPLLLKFIVNLFCAGKSRAQLIYTTHDTTLMDRKFFRRDQVWFVQKDESGHSELSSLAEFKIRSDASFEKDYLAGVYGGIPKLKDFYLDEGDENGN